MVRSSSTTKGSGGLLPLGPRRPARSIRGGPVGRRVHGIVRPGATQGAEHAGRAPPSGEVCVCDFVDPLGKSQPTISHHLKILNEAGLIRGDRRGKWVWYSLDRDRLAALRAAIDT